MSAPVGQLLPYLGRKDVKQIAAEWQNELVNVTIELETGQSVLISARTPQESDALWETAVANMKNRKYKLVWRRK